MQIGNVFSFPISDHFVSAPNSLMIISYITLSQFFLSNCKFKCLNQLPCRFYTHFTILPQSTTSIYRVYGIPVPPFPAVPVFCRSSACLLFAASVLTLVKDIYSIANNEQIFNSNVLGALRKSEGSILSSWRSSIAGKRRISSSLYYRTSKFRRNKGASKNEWNRHRAPH